MNIFLLKVSMLNCSVLVESDPMSGMSHLKVSFSFLIVYKIYNN